MLRVILRFNMRFVMLLSLDNGKYLIIPMGSSSSICEKERWEFAVVYRLQAIK